MQPWPLAVFTKPWTLDLPTLARKLQALGVDSIELPVRPGYPVHPENVGQALPEAARILADAGVRIFSIAGPVDEPTIAACGEAGVPIIRVCVAVDRELGYHGTVARLQQEWERLIPALQRHGVKIGLQNHSGAYIGSAIGLWHAIGRFDPRHVGAVLDVAHCALAGEPEEVALDIVWSHLCLVNLKNAFRMRLNGPEREAQWRVYWTTGRHGYASWRKTLRYLHERGYRGPLCLTAEYSDPRGGALTGDAVDPLIADDLAYVRSLLAGS